MRFGLVLGNCRFSHLCAVLEAGLGGLLAPPEDIGPLGSPRGVVVSSSPLAIEFLLHFLQLPQLNLYLLFFRTVIFYLGTNCLLARQGGLQLHHLGDSLLLHGLHSRVLLEGDGLDLLRQFLRFIEVVVLLYDLEFVEYGRTADLLPHLLRQRLLQLRVGRLLLGGGEELLLEDGLEESILGNHLDRLVEAGGGVRKLRGLLTETSRTERSLRKVLELRG